MSNFNEQIMKELSKELKITVKQIENVLKLLEEGNTVPFIARYRKEVTGALDEEQIFAINKEWEYKNNLAKRKEDVIRLISEKGMMTEDLLVSINNANKLTEIEDIYRPFKEKKKTKATNAKAKGLEPLAQWLLTFPEVGDVLEEANKYLSSEEGKEVENVKDALQGAMDIIAEIVSDNPVYRKWIREYTYRNGDVKVKVKDKEKDERGVFEMYYDYHEPVNQIRPHRVLAVNRGKSEGVLTFGVSDNLEAILKYIGDSFITNEKSIAIEYIKAAIEDGYKRLIKPSIEREILSELKQIAEEQAISIFSENLKNLLLQPPMKEKVVLGVDPAYRTGCKVAVVDGTGKVLEINVIYPHEKYKGESVPQDRLDKAEKILLNFFEKYPIEIVAIGNGTASRETEQFVSDVIRNNKVNASYIIVNEAGASVYSASELARKEFPDLHVEERSAISISRRLQDPLAELVKIDPKSIGVGQYQHDVTQSKLNESLKFVVETAVNKVGVNVNTASPSLLQYVSGCSSTVANNIVKHRESKGKFISRKELKEVPRFGAKSFEQAIGFLRIVDGDEPLDTTAIHTENYQNAKTILNTLGFTSADIGSEELKTALSNIDKEEIKAKTGLGVHTLEDILQAFIAPNRDPRDEFEKPLLRTDVLKLEDLKPGMELQGTVRNVVDFGAFVDCGVKEDGLVHISKLSNSYVKHPMDVVGVGDIVKVWVHDIDVKKGRLSLTMLKPQ